MHSGPDTGLRSPSSMDREAFFSGLDGIRAVYS